MSEELNVPLPGSEILPLPGSEKKPIAGARSTGPAHPEEQVNVTLRIRKNSTFGVLLPNPSRDDAAAAMSADPKDIQEVVNWVKASGLNVGSASATERNVKVSGTVAQINTAFGTTLENYQAPPTASQPAGFNYRGRTGPVMLPKHLVTDDNGTPVIEGVFGLDDRPAGEPHYRKRSQGVVAHAGGGGFLARDLASIYDFPPNAGVGQVVGIIALGGQYHPADLQEYAALCGFNLSPNQVQVVLVDGAQPSPSDADVETALDYQTILGAAPNARAVIYQAPNTDAGFLDAVTAAMHDTVNKPTVISISWGSPESNWTNSAMRAMAQAFQDAATLGITVCVAAGDNGSSDGTSQSSMADFPASAPYAVACGGTRLVASGTQVQSETVWGGAGSDGATGGAPSRVFAVPSYQQGVTQLQMRGVCDVGAVADPATGYRIVSGGQEMVIGGTSGAAPLWAACIARLNANLPKPIGFVHPLLYKPGVCRNIVVGTNGVYSAGVGYNYPTGMGVPIGTRLLEAAIGAPPTPTPIPPPSPPPVPPPIATITQEQLKKIIDGVFTYLERQATSRYVVLVIEAARKMADSELAALWAFLKSIGAV